MPKLYNVEKGKIKMATFSETFGISKNQAELDFVDIELSTDVQLYLCPYAIQIREDDWSNQCGDHIRSFFTEVLGQLRDGNVDRVTHLLSNLHEPNETHLGQSKSLPSGRGVGNDKALQLASALRNSTAFATGVLSDISEAELFVEGIGRDTISDLTTNLLRGILAEYTRQQCALYGVPLSRTSGLGPIWNLERRDWESAIQNLPAHNGQHVLLVPKFSVRRKLSLDSQEFYNMHMVEFLQEEYLNSSSALVQVLQNGNRRVTKKSVKEHHPFRKNDIAAFVRNHPEVLETYKELKGAQGSLSASELDEGFDEPVFATALQHNLGLVPTGSSHASQYHNIAIGICTFLFFPYLICPIKEFEQHDGRKRVDIKFTNAAQGGFFHSRMISAQTRANSVFVECKNYTDDIDNPALDQIAGRFGHQRGFLGIVLCRNLDNRTRTIATCRDTAGDGRGYVIVLEDADLRQMLDYISQGRRAEIDRMLISRFDEITN